MKLKFALSLLLSIAIAFAYAQRPAADREPVKTGDNITIQPITHATFVLTYQGKNIYVDPTGGADAFKGISAPDIILITDIHGDHFDPKPLRRLIPQRQLLWFHRRWLISCLLLPIKAS